MRTAVLSLILFLSTATAAHAEVWFVDAAQEARPQDGRSWDTAFRTIQPAIDAAAQDGGGEVWVAAGVYDERRPGTYGGRDTGALLLRAGVRLYGGFQGVETEQSARNPQEHVTIIDGSQARGRRAPAFHVVIGADNALLDGFVIQGGQAEGGVSAEGTGAGLLNYYTATQVRNCVFRQNTGGAIANYYGEPVISDSYFTANEGPAIFNHSAQPRIEEVRIEHNRSSRYSAGIYNFYSTPVVRNAEFLANEGIALHNYASNATLEGIAFESSAGDTALDAFILNEHSEPRFARISAGGQQYYAEAAVHHVRVAASQASTGPKQLSGINALVPDEGATAGGNAVQLQGIFFNFPTLTSISAANATYAVYFGSTFDPSRLASFNTVGGIVLDSDEVNVIAPPAPDGFNLVTVQVVDRGTFDTVAFNSYNYTDAPISALVPNTGVAPRFRCSFPSPSCPPSPPPPRRRPSMPSTSATSSTVPGGPALTSPPAWSWKATS